MNKTCILFIAFYFPFNIITLVIFWVKIDKYRRQFEAQANVLDSVI